MIKKITYEDKIPIKTDETVARKNKVTAEDFKEIKEVVNANAELLETNNTNIQAEQETQNINIESLQKENAEIKQDISKIQTEQKTQNTTIESLQKENTEIKQEISNIQEKIGDIDTILDTINGEVI